MSRNRNISMLMFSTILGCSLHLSECALAQDADITHWLQLDTNQDGWLSGRELGDNWLRFDVDGDKEVTKAEFLAGRNRERVTPAAPLDIAPPPSLPENTPSKPASKLADRVLATTKTTPSLAKPNAKGERPSMPAPSVMSTSKIEGLFYRQRYEMVSRHLEKAVWYFAPDGKVYVNLESGFSATELAAHQGQFGTYQVANGQMSIAWSNGSKSKNKLEIAQDAFDFDTATFLPVKPFRSADQLVGNYEGGSSFSFSGSSTAIAKTLTLRADGTFASSGIANFSKDRSNAGFSDSNNKELIASGQGGSNGTWSLSGYSLTLSSAGEKDTVGIVFPLFVDETKGSFDRIFFRGFVYKK